MREIGREGEREKVREREGEREIEREKGKWIIYFIKEIYRAHFYHNFIFYT